MANRYLLVCQDAQELMNKAPNSKKTVIGTVVEALPDTLFRVEIAGETGTDVILAYLSGKMRLHRIRVMIGDRVELEIDQYGGKARIIKRI